MSTEYDADSEKLYFEEGDDPKPWKSSAFSIIRVVQKIFMLAWCLTLIAIGCSLIYIGFACARVMVMLLNSTGV